MGCSRSETKQANLYTGLLQTGFSLVVCRQTAREADTPYTFTWYLEAHGCLPAELTGFCAHLTTQGSVLSLMSGVEYSRAQGKNKLAPLA